MGNNRSREDYLEVIYILSKDRAYLHRIDIARYMGVSQPAVEKAVKLLTSAGYLRLDGLHIYLTESGLCYAEKVYTRHSTICNFLAMHGVDEEVADADACEIEHVISDESFAMMADWIEKHKSQGLVCPLTGRMCERDPEFCDREGCGDGKDRQGG